MKEPNIEYLVQMYIDGNVVAVISGYSYESLGEQWHKLETTKERFNNGDYDDKNEREG